MKEANLRTMLRLLEPHLRPRLPAFALLFLLGTLVAFAQNIVVVLIYPAVDVLFPLRNAPGEGASGWLLGPTMLLREWVLGPTGVPDSKYVGAVGERPELAQLCGDPGRAGAVPA